MPATVGDGFSPFTSQGERPDGSMDYVVISGISCRLPESENMDEFRRHLMNGESMVTVNRRWESGSHGLPHKSGTLKDISKFDAGFFGVPPKLANNMDPQLRIMLELTFEALIDSGVPPVKMRGSNTAVYIGCGMSETWEALSTDSSNVTGYSPLGCTNSMFANRISFAFDFRGPSIGLRNGCASGMLALDRAVLSIRQGHCDSAIVAGSNLCLKPAFSVQLAEMNLLSSDGQCRCFENEGEGFGRSEGIVVMYLQRKAKAKRVYCTVIHSKSSTFVTGSSADMNYPSFEEERKFLEETYREARLDPSHISYIETGSSCTKMSDSLEINAIADVICGNRSKPLLIGSVKSSIGHTEAASGLAAVSKIVLAMEDGVIPPTLIYNASAIQNGKFKIVNERQRLNGEYCGVNSFGLGGVNIHTILKSFSDKTNKYHFANEKKRLCVYSARTMQSLKSIFHLMKTHTKDSYLHFLLNETSGPLNKQLPCRGYCLLNCQTSLEEEHRKTELETKPPVWFVFSGMGNQWPKMGRQMMQIDMFRSSIMKCDRVLRPHGIHLYDMIMEGDTKTYDSVTNSFVALAAIQVSLVDMLFSMNLKPNGIVGHSVGELGCGYADGCLTTEETVLAAYWRGFCITEAKLPPGGMAAIGMTWEEAKQQCPEGVVPACHNAKGTVTISGPKDKVSEYVQKLKEKQIFAKEVNSAGVAFHSAIMQKVSPRVKEETMKIIKPKPRTSKWVSSSIPESEWDSDLAKTASADYLVNNLVSPVLFQEALKHIPSNAVVIEIAPHGLLQAVLKRSLDNCFIASLMKREHPCNPEFFYVNLGKCYNSGVDFNPLGIFPPVEHPVPRGTPMIAPAVKWDHQTTWYVPKDDEFLSGSSGRQAESRFEFDVSKNDQDKYLTGHKIEGRILFPASGYVVLAWKALAKFHGKILEGVPVVLENVKIHRATLVPLNGSLRFEVSLVPALREFEICEGNGLVASGIIYFPSGPVSGYTRDIPPSSPRKKKELDLAPSDIYKEFRLRGYEYDGSFRGIYKAVNRGEHGELLWEDNWISFIDTMMQMNLLIRLSPDLILPTGIRLIRINPESHRSAVKSTDISVVPIFVNKFSETTIAGGIEMNGLQLTSAPRKLNQQPIILEKHVFCPDFEVGGKELSAEDLKEYCSKCSSIAANGILRMMGMEGLTFTNFNLLKQVSKTLTPVRFVEDVDRYFKMKKNGLFLVLHKLFSMSVDNFLENCKNVLDAYKSELLNDRLLSNLTRERSLKACLDIVLENMSGTMKVIELDAECNSLSELMLHYLNSQPMANIDYIKCTRHVHPSAVRETVWNPEDSPAVFMEGIQLVICFNFLHKQSNIGKCLKNISKSINDDAFLLVHEVTRNVHLDFAVMGLLSDLPVLAETRSVGCYCDEDKWKEMFEKENFQIVCQKSDGLMNTLFLLRKHAPISLMSQTVLKVEDDITKSVEVLKEKLQEVAEKPKGQNLWLLTENTISGIMGLVNCLRKEPGGEKIRCIMNASGSVDKVRVTEELVNRDMVMNVWQDGTLGSYRHLPIYPEPKLEENSSCFMDISRKGDLSSLCWKHNSDDLSDTQTTKVHCNVHYVSLGIKDLMFALGKLPGDQMYHMGTEFSGLTDQGRRVMGVIDRKALATNVSVDQNCLFDIPEGWSLREAATVPSSYGLAYYALIMRGKICRESRVLISNASSSLGQAAVSIALSLGCFVFALVNSKECQQYLVNFGDKEKQNVFVSDKTEQFIGKILRQTKGKGVDTVFTSTSGNLHEQMLNVLKAGGKYLDLSSDFIRESLDKDNLHENINYYHIRTNNFSSEELTQIAKLISQGIKDKVVHPLEYSYYPHTKTQQAFQQLQDPSNLKSVLVQIRGDESASVKVLTESRLFCQDKIYIIIGGLGGFGLELAEWLAKEGATRLVLTSRSGVTTGYQERKLRLLRGQNIEISISNRNVTIEEECQSLIEENKKLGSIGGVFNLAMVLEDGLFENQTAETFRKACEPKVEGTMNLDKITRKDCETMDYFIVFSSITSGRGNVGQANYGYANSVMERLCEQRRKDGLPGLAIQWGAIDDVGVVIDKMGGNVTAVGGTEPQKITSCIDTLKKLVAQSSPVVSSYVLAEKCLVSDYEDFAQEKKPTPLETVMKVLGITDTSSVNPATIMIDIGLDSLMTTEIKQLMERQFGIVLTVDEVRKLTVKQLKEYSKDEEEIKSKNGFDILKDLECKLNHEAITADFLQPLEEILLIKTFENDAEPVFFINLLPEWSGSFIPLVQHLNHRVYVIQCTEDTPLYSIQTLAGHYLQEIDLIHPDKPIHLIGYSIGGRVALEMAIQKQRDTSESPIKSLTIIETPLPLIEKTLKAIKPGPDRQREILKSFLHVLSFSGIDLTNKTPGEMIKEVCDVIVENSKEQLENQDVINSILSFIQKMTILIDYTPEGQYDGKIVIVTPKNITDIRAQEYFKQKIEHVKMEIKDTIFREMITKNLKTLLHKNLGK